MTAVNFDFTGIADGQQLNAFEPLFVKMTDSATNTIVGGSTAGTLSFVGTNGTPTSHAYDTGNVRHSFKVTYASTASGSFLTCCARMLDYRNMLAVRFSATSTLELVSLTTGVPALIEAWTVTRGANDTVEIIVGDNDQISVKHNDVLKVFVGTGLTYKVITTFAGATKVGFCARSGGATNFITAATVTYSAPTIITGVNGGTNTIKLGSTGNSFATTGLTGITGASLGGLAMTSVSGSASPWSFDCPGITDGQVSPYPLATFSAVGAEGTGTLTNVAVTLPDGVVAQNLVGTLNTSNTGVIHNLNPAAVAGVDKIIYPPVPAEGKYITVSATGGIDTNYFAPVQFIHWEGATGIFRYYTVDTSLLGVDINPDAGSFGSVTEATPGAVTELTGVVTIVGVTADTDCPAVATAGTEYQVSTDGGSTYGAWTTATTNVRLTYKLRARKAASASTSSSVTATVTVGSTVFTGSITTRAGISVPNQLVFASYPNSELLTEHTSSTQTVAGMDAGETSAFTVANGTYSKNGGTFISTAGTLENGDTFALRGTSDTYFGRTKSVALTAANGNVVSTYRIINKSDPLLPNLGGSTNQISGRKITGRKV